MKFVAIYLNSSEMKGQLFPTLINAARSINLEQQPIHGQNFKTSLSWNMEELKTLPLNWQAELINIENGNINLIKSLVTDV